MIGRTAVAVFSWLHEEKEGNHEHVSSGEVSGMRARGGEGITSDELDETDGARGDANRGRVFGVEAFGLAA